MLTVLIVSAIMSGCIEDAPEPTIVLIPEFVITEPITEPTVILTVDPITVSSIPDDYYNITIDQHFIDHQLYNYLEDYTWGRPIWKGMWSMQETAEMEKILTDKGCNVTIRLALLDSNYRVPDKYLPAKGSDDYERSCYNDSLSQYSSWLMIELNGEMTAYNAYHGFWIFEPQHHTHDRARIDGKWRDDGYYSVGGDWTSAYGTCTMTKFIDFKNIYELEEYYLSGTANRDWLNTNQYGKWFDYANSDKYNTTDGFLITFGWWVSDEEYHERETRINEATNWFKLVDI